MMYDDFGSYENYAGSDERFESTMELRRKQQEIEFKMREEQAKSDEKERHRRQKIRKARNRNIKKITSTDYDEFEFKLEMLETKWSVVSIFKDENTWVAMCEEILTKRKIKILEIKE